MNYFKLQIGILILFVMFLLHLWTLSAIEIQNWPYWVVTLPSLAYSGHVQSSHQIFRENAVPAAVCRKHWLGNTTSDSMKHQAKVCSWTKQLHQSFRNMLTDLFIWDQTVFLISKFIFQHVNNKWFWQKYVDYQSAFFKHIKAPGETLGSRSRGAWGRNTIL